MTRGYVLETFDTVALGMHLRRRSTLLLFGAGIAAALLHAATRFPLHLPGHEGLEWMAILMLARLASPYRWAASVAALGAAAAAPFLGFHDPLTPIAYLLPGVVLDIVALLSARNLLATVLGAALGYTAHPLLDWVALRAFGVHFGPASLAFGAHVLFGLAGALLGVGLWKFARR
jgi:hypothetical protein